MEPVGNQVKLSDASARHLIDLIDACVRAEDLADYIQLLFSALGGITGSDTTCLFVSDPRSGGTDFFQTGLAIAEIDKVKEACESFQSRLSTNSSIHFSQEATPPPLINEAGLTFIPLMGEHSCLGVLGVAENHTLELSSPETWEGLPALLASLLDNLLEKVETKRQLSHLNSYLTVSSTLSQSLDLHELLELSLYCCMEVLPVEAASILLLDDDKKNFTFYEIEGSAKTILKSATFPSDRGIAGAVLQSRASEIINDVYSDPRFYQKVDSTTGFRTRNMIAIPLVAGEEKVGVLEFMNKLDGGQFQEEELLWLIPLADEIAFAVRNAILFEYVASTYCKQRQGMMSCRGCQRPLGSWTPCVKYRAVDVLGEKTAPSDTLNLPVNPQEPI